MNFAPKRQLLALTATLLVFSTGQAAEAPTPEQMWEIIQQQHQQIEALQRQLDQTSQKTDEIDVKVAETDQKVELAGDMIEQAALSSASSGSSTSIGGYGELHYNNLDSGDMTAIKPQLSQRRAVNRRALRQAARARSGRYGDQHPLVI